VGERSVADQLERLRPHGWFLLHDVHWPGRPKAMLDHVLVGPGGVLVVDAKNWTGEVNVAAGVLWQGRFARTQSVEGALAQCAAVASILAPPHRRFVRPLICIAGQASLFGITSSDVAVAGPERAVDAILALPPVLDGQAVKDLYAHLRRELTQQQEPAGESPGGTRRPPAAPRLPDVPAKQRHPVPGQARHSQHQGQHQAGGQARQGHQPRHFHSRYGLLAHGQGGHGAARNPGAQQKAGGGMAYLLFLGAFVVFAVYVLPYWGQ
jgi:hypothetical protein